MLFQEQYKYKYVPWGAGAKEILKSATLKFTKPDDFNDAFDCNIVYKPNGHISKSQSKLVSTIINQNGGSPAQRIRERKRLKNQFSNVNQNGEWNGALRNNIGVCCFSRSPSNSRMWANYARNHTGVAFEFQNVIPDEPELMRYYLSSFVVEYQHTRPKLDIRHISWRDELLVKGDDWSYEQEVRCIDLLNGAGIYPYRRELLSSVILGARTSTSDENEVRKLVESVNQEYGQTVRVYKAKLSEDSFDILITDH